jgi:hypothetical protein
MIIDIILDRKDGINYKAKNLYNYAMGCQDVAGATNIADSLDNGTDKQVKKALCHYIIDNDYDIDICKYINSVNWL